MGINGTHEMYPKGKGDKYRPVGINGTHMRCTGKGKVTNADTEIKLPLKSQDIRVEISQIITVIALDQCTGIREFRSILWIP